MGARNDYELAKMLAPAVIKGVEIMAEQDLKPEIQQDIRGVVNRGEYMANTSGSLAEAWSVTSKVNSGLFSLGNVTTVYDNNLLTYDSGYQFGEYGVYGKHTSPSTYYDGEDIEDMALLIDQGLGGPLYGVGGYTQQPTYFWENLVIPNFESRKHDWIVSGLKQAGLRAR